HHLDQPHLGTNRQHLKMLLPPPNTPRGTRTSRRNNPPPRAITPAIRLRTASRARLLSRLRGIRARPPWIHRPLYRWHLIAVAFHRTSVLDRVWRCKDCHELILNETYPAPVS